MTDPDNSARMAAVGVIQVLRRAGHVGYLAGGCVRDGLLGVAAKDFDVATSARPEVVRGLFKRSQYVGEAFGVVLVYGPTLAERGLGGEGAGGNLENKVGKNQGLVPAGVEVATFRVEWGYEDGRRPGAVEFTDAEHDAQRRDFTVNGLFADPLDEKLEPVAPGKEKVIDYVGGVADLKAGVLRAIGVAGERFNEDYLRMLRAVRFAARFGFEIETETAKAIRASAKKLSGISRERIGQEVRLMLTGPGPAVAAGLMQALKLDGPTLGGDCVRAELGALSGVVGGEKEDGPTLGERGFLGGTEESGGDGAGDVPRDETPGGYGLVLGAWMLDRAGASGSLEAAAGFAEKESRGVLGVWRKALCLSNDDRDEVASVMGLVVRAAGWAGLGVAKRKRLLAEPGWGMALRLLRVVGAGEAEVIERESVGLIAEGVSPVCLVNGDDLLGMGVSGGPRIGELLEGVYDEQLEGRVRDREEGLAWVRGELGVGG